MLPKIYFVPSYVGSLKHFARIAPYLKEKYNLGFLIIHPNRIMRDGMIKYCQENNLPYFVLSDGLDYESKIRVPFFTPLRKRFIHSRECREFLRKENPVKIISTKMKYPHDLILKEANNLEIEIILLQWAIASLRTVLPPRHVPFFRKMYLAILNFFSYVLDLCSRESRYQTTLAIPQKVGVFSRTEAREKEKYFDPKTISVLGTIDFQAVHELKRKIDSNSLYKKELLKKYKLDEKKIKITIILYRFYYIKTDMGMTEKEHIKHYYDILTMIRSVFSPEEAEIILKLHPAEKNIYESYKELGVKLYHDESNTDELVCLSDLYISDPCTNVVNMVLGSNVSAIFINLPFVDSMNVCKDFFNIKYVAESKDDFINKLHAFKNNTLEKQYDNSSINTRSIDATIEFIG